MCECEDINIYIHSIYTCMYNCLFCICIPKTKKGTNSAHNSKRIRSFSCLGFCVLSLSRIGLTVSPIIHMIMYKNLSLSILYIDNCAQTLDTLEKTNNPISFRLEWKSSLINYFYIQIRTYIYTYIYGTVPHSNRNYQKKKNIYMVYVHHSVLWNCEFLLEHSKCFDFPKTCSSII